ncbi:MAG: hypothetical protein ABGY96_00440 [bacterium]|nr:hypothetical protein [Gammaproteobacteria bacterium]HIL94482.1 hypothetical protein [Pseudomonadales bacterium]
MFAVSIKVKPDFDYGNPELLFTGSHGLLYGYDISHGGQQFLTQTFGTTELESKLTSLVVVENWYQWRGESIEFLPKANASESEITEGRSLDTLLPHTFRRPLLLLVDGCGKNERVQRSGSLFQNGDS